MIEKIKELEKISRLLDPKQNQRAEWNTAVLNYADTFIEALDTARAYRPSDTNGKDIYQLDITEEATELNTLLAGTIKKH